MRILFLGGLLMLGAYHFKQPAPMSYHAKAQRWKVYLKDGTVWTDVYGNEKLFASFAEAIKEVEAKLDPYEFGHIQMHEVDI